MEWARTEREDDNDRNSRAFVLRRIQTWVMRREENKWTVLLGEQSREWNGEREGERGMRKELAPFLFFFLAWQSAFWQNVWYPLHMGNPAEKERHTRTHTQIQGAKSKHHRKLWGDFRGRVLSPPHSLTLRLTEKPRLALIRQNNFHSCFRSVCASRGLGTWGGERNGKARK